MLAFQTADIKSLYTCGMLRWLRRSAPRHDNGGRHGERSEAISCTMLIEY
jgi:hypothetical protein